MPALGVPRLPHARCSAFSLALFVLALCASAAPADAATLSVHINYEAAVENHHLKYTAAAGERNRLVVTEDESVITFTDPGVTIESDGCETPAPGVATCRKGGYIRGPIRLEANLGDEDDSARVDIPADGVFSRPGASWGAASISGGPGADELTGSDAPADDTISDYLVGGPGADRLLGRGGNDSLDGAQGGDHMDGGPGRDWFQGRGLTALPGDDADTFAGGNGADHVNYGYQNDPPPENTASYGRVTQDLRAIADGLANDGAAGEGDNIGADIESVQLGSGNDYAESSGALRSFNGSDGNDEMNTGALTGDHHFSGDSGDDALIAKTGTNNNHFQGGEGDDLLMGADGRDALSGFEGNDRIVGGPGNDHLDGDQGDDWIDARDPGGSTLFDRAGHDRLQCGAGQDETYVDDSEARVMAPWDGCELVHAPPRIEPPPLPVLSATASAGEKRVMLHVGCRSEGGACGGELVLKAKSAILARGKFAMERGKAKRVAIPLTKAGRGLLGRRSRLVARASAKPQVAGAKTVKQRVVIKRR